MLNTSNATVWTVYEHFPQYERRMEGSTATLTKSYFFGGQRIAQKVGSDAFTYIHADHLGSVVKTTGVAEDKKYTPYGAHRSSTAPLPTDRTFTGQEDDGSYLLYYGARYYDPRTGQFMSPDTIIPTPTTSSITTAIYMSAGIR